MRGLRAVILLGVMAAGTAAWGQASATPALVPASSPASLSERQKLLLEQTNLLLKLAAELKVSVDKSTKDQLSLEVVRKAEAVEKMAKELKGKIK